uniref:Uncharacterized protein n=1 Tax=Octopus bimaculoides TaxID=37653 RepID=A0A0L8HZY7_OCTBM
MFITKFCPRKPRKTIPKDETIIKVTEKDKNLKNNFDHCSARMRWVCPTSVLRRNITFNQNGSGSSYQRCFKFREASIQRFHSKCRKLSWV